MKDIQHEMMKQDIEALAKRIEQLERASLSGAPPCSASEPRVITIRADDWAGICSVMRSLTWGKSSMDDWHRVRERVEKRNLPPQNAGAVATAVPESNQTARP